MRNCSDGKGERIDGGIRVWENRSEMERVKDIEWHGCGGVIVMTYPYIPLSSFPGHCTLISTD